MSPSLQILFRLLFSLSASFNQASCPDRLWSIYLSTAREYSIIAMCYLSSHLSFRLRIEAAWRLEALIVHLRAVLRFFWLVRSKHISFSQRVAFQAREGLTTRTMERSLLLWKQAAGWRFTANNAGWQFNEMRKKWWTTNIVGHGLSWLPLLGKDEGQEGLRLKENELQPSRASCPQNLPSQYPRIGCKLFSFSAL